MSHLLRRFSLIAACLTACLTVASPAMAGGSKIAKSMGNLRWGMSDLDVGRVLKAKLKERYGPKLKKASGARKESLKREVKAKLRSIEKLIEFDGGRSSWDSSSVGDEYTHGNSESMLVFDDGDAKAYYFFIEGRLWKWVKSYPASAFGGSNFKKFKRTVDKRFGNGMVKEGRYYPGIDQQYRWVEFLDRNTRLRAVDKTSNYGEYALVFEQMETVRSLSALRGNTTRKNKTRPNKLASASSSDSERSGKLRRAKSPAVGTLRNNKKRSVLGDDGADESDQEYEARRKRVIAERKEKQRRLHERKQDQKKGKVLDDLAGLDNDDPLSGMK